ncbi:MAG: serine/threonine protein kinase [Planctomycetaceae bacterium]|nr:serine/threonine protein kinase [Planctomycetaceae bacterium]
MTKEHADLKFEKIGPYLIHEKLGSGGMGTVYLGKHEETGRIAAIKVLPPTLAQEEGFVERFNREIDSLKRLKNPHIVEFYDNGEDHGTYYYSMEYVPGETLTHILRRTKRIPWEDTIDYGIQVCSALKSAHDAGIIHRDLKPSNLMLTPDNQIKLTDFGVAQLFASQRLTVTGGIVGTAEYMSPEQAQGQRASRKSDLYSFGAVLYVLLTGRVPFSGNTTVEVLHKHRYSRFDPPRLIVPEIPHWYDELICQLLEKNPDKRPPDAFVVGRMLDQIRRKVEISSGETTADIRPDSASAATRADNVDDGPGPATLMKQLVRSELDQQQQGSTLENIFNNTWVLVGLLILLILGGIWWNQTKALNPEQLFTKGEELMESEDFDDWKLAKLEYFDPLLERDSATWKPKIQVHLDKIQAMQSLRVPTRRPLSDESEPRRLLNLARDLYARRDFVRAEEVLKDLQMLLKVSPDESKRTGDEVEKLQKRWEEENKIRARNADWLDRTLKGAEDALQQNQFQEAADLCTAVIRLYSGDSLFEDQVAKARRLLEQAEASSKTVEPPNPETNK